ncbi:MAG: hypothetical protein IJS50_05275, partial [Desulfovibrio sp.]|nr:hypothetical protein [Desulfovibrio sp.]
MDLTTANQLLKYAKKSDCVKLIVKMLNLDMAQGLERWFIEYCQGNEEKLKTTQEQEDVYSDYNEFYKLVKKCNRRGSLVTKDYNKALSFYKKSLEQFSSNKFPWKFRKKIIDQLVEASAYL